MSTTLLHQAIAAAKAGRRIQARTMLLEYLQQDPRSEVAWLWLSEMLVDLEDKIEALEKALSINPHNDKVRDRLTQFQQQQAAIEVQERAAKEPLYQQITEKIRSGRIDQARGQLLQMVGENPKDERAWLLLSEILPELEDQYTALQNVLKINPHHQQAQSRLADLQQLEQNALVEASIHQRRGNYQQAAAAYQRAAAQADSPAQRKAIQQEQKKLQVETGIEIPGKEVSFFIHLARLTAGPPLLFVLMSLIQSGMKPFQIPAVLWVGSLVVLLGSLLAVIASFQPKPPLWQKLFAEGDVMLERVAQIALGGLGLLLLLLPFVWQIVESIVQVRELGR